MSYDTEWHFVGEVGEPAFENGAYTYSLKPLRFIKTSNGVVRIEGFVSIYPETYFSQSCFTLPEGYRPVEGALKLQDFHGTNSDYVDINTAGEVSPNWLNAEINVSFFVGPAALEFLTWEAGSYSINDIRMYGGTAYVSQVNNNTSTPGTNSDWDELKGDKGDQGIQGVPGPSGNLENVAVGTIWMFDANNSGGGGTPSGASGAWSDNGTMSGWYACVSANSIYGCPDLVNKFLMGKVISGSGITGGSSTHTILLSELPTHTHIINHDHPSFSSGTVSAWHKHGYYDKHAATDAEFDRTNQQKASDWDQTDYYRTTLNPSANHTHTINVPLYSGSSGDGGFANNPIDIKPAYYSLIFIRKCS